MKKLSTNQKLVYRYTKDGLKKLGCDYGSDDRVIFLSKNLIATYVPHTGELAHTAVPWPHKVILLELTDEEMPKNLWVSKYTVTIFRIPGRLLNKFNIQIKD